MANITILESVHKVLSSVPPILAAFVLNAFGVILYINREFSPPCDDAPCGPHFLFLIGTYFLMMDILLYPKSFRPIHWIPRFIVEFLVCKLCLEVFLALFWFPFENLVYVKIPTMLDLCFVLHNNNRCIFYNDVSIYKAIGGKILSHFLCYLFAIAFLLCVLHTTWVLEVDLTRSIDISSVLNNVYKKVMCRRIRFRAVPDVCSRSILRNNDNTCESNCSRNESRHSLRRTRKSTSRT